MIRWQYAVLAAGLLALAAGLLYTWRFNSCWIVTPVP